MLGLVRIYSKKVKYLMIDCTDAMWKMQLAFQPGRVDIDSQHNQNVDDNRFYGNISLDMDYPVLDNVAFVPSLLPISQNPFSRTKDDEVREIVASQLSDIEFVRAGDRNSLSVTRPSLSFERKVSLSSKFEDEIPMMDVPAFEQDMLLPALSLEPFIHNLEPEKFAFNEEIETVEKETKQETKPKRRKVCDFFSFSFLQSLFDVSFFLFDRSWIVSN